MSITQWLLTINFVLIYGCRSTSHWLSEQCYRQSNIGKWKLMKGMVEYWYMDLEGGRERP